MVRIVIWWKILNLDQRELIRTLLSDFFFLYVAKSFSSHGRFAMVKSVISRCRKEKLKPTKSSQEKGFREGTESTSHIVQQTTGNIQQLLGSKVVTTIAKDNTGDVWKYEW